MVKGARRATNSAAELEAEYSSLKGFYLSILRAIWQLSL